MLLPTESAVYGTGFRYSEEENPFVQFAAGDDQALKRFYGRYQPRTLEEAFSPVIRDYRVPELDEFASRVDGIPLPSKNPWLTDLGDARAPQPIMEEKVFKEHVGPEHGTQSRGPVSRTKLELEEERVRRILSSVHQSGFIVSPKHAVRGHFLARGEELLFLVAGGQHRTAVAAAQLGVVPVRIQPGYPTIVDLEDLEGYFRRTAELYFDETARACRRRLVARHG